MPKTLIKRPNLNTSKIKSVKEKPKIIDKDKLKEFKEKLLSGSGFLKIH